MHKSALQQQLLQTQLLPEQAQYKIDKLPKVRDLDHR